ncbi:MAG: hydroxymethylglutaryl-CoA reductase, degradative [Candidatus Hadarchaeota archaeon]
MNESSRISGFYKLSPEERLKLVKEISGLSKKESEILEENGSLSIKQADKMLENVIGTFELPFGIAVNFLINGKDYLIPMVIEESSVVAAASNGAKIARKNGGFKTESTDPIMIGQIQITDLEDIESAKRKIDDRKEDILKLANQQDPTLIEAGGGARDLELREINTEKGNILVAHLLIDTKDAMGANAVNTMAEAVAPMIEEITDGNVLLRIISNLADKRIAKAEAVFGKEELGGKNTVDKIIGAYHFALADQYRCATHNKGIMNGIEAVALATGNDTRALEAGGHAYACKNGRYKPLTKWEKTENGDLRGSIELPIAVGIIGGVTKVNPLSKVALKILNVDSSKELSEVMAALGLAQNLAALRALAEEGIQKGHMKLHAKNIAALVSSEEQYIDQIAERMIEKDEINMEKAKEIFSDLQRS